MLLGRNCLAVGRALTLALVLAGCSGLTAAPRSPLPDIETLIAGRGSAEAPGLQSAYTPKALDDCFAQPLPGEAARRCRDRIVQALITAINLRYAEFEIGFFDANRYTNFGATVAVLGLGAAGTISGANATQALSAAITAITGSRAAFNREVMLEQTAAALLTAMRAQRDIAELRIRHGLARPASEYPLGIALSDVYAFFRAGTIPGALAGVTQAVGLQGETAQAGLRLAVVGRGLSTGDLALRMREFLDAPGLTEAERDSRMQAFMEARRAEGLDAVPVASLTRAAGPEAESRLARIARRMGLAP